ncbi:hypothetical protein B0H19DRAFT_1075542 [Mycena capillaripes]|nr:hypothetical protein B0H19DRAFT_1075542 [Mycena capillaripes]
MPTFGAAAFVSKRWEPSVDISAKAVSFKVCWRGDVMPARVPAMLNVDCLNPTLQTVSVRSLLRSFYGPFIPKLWGARTPPELYGTKTLDTLTINSNPQIHSTP